MIPMRIKTELIAAARARHSVILPCAGRILEDGFIEQAGQLQFWFNDATGSTRMVYENEIVHAL